MNIKHASLFYRFVKRAFDIFAGVIGFLLILLPFMIIFFGIAWTSTGPVIYKDRRVGRKGKPFNLLKFRSMYVDANDHPEKYLNEEQMKQFLAERKVDDDPRIAPFGHFIRKTSLDELPQILNIIKGDMSIVGPRAITQEELDKYYDDEQKAIITSVRPGLTGYWQVHGRNKVTYESGERTKAELKYFEKRGIFYDLGIIFKTIPALFRKDEVQ